MDSWLHARKIFLTLVLALVALQNPSQATDGKPQANDMVRPLTSFFQHVFQETVFDNGRSAFMNTTNFIWDNLKTSEKFTEETDADGKTTRGYLTIEFLLPPDTVPPQDSKKEPLVIAKPVPGQIIDWQVMRSNGTLNYKYGCLGSRIEAADALRKVSLKLQIYEDTRYSRITNLGRFNLPTASRHLVSDNLQKYLSQAFLGIIQEWILVAANNDQKKSQELTQYICKDASRYLRAKQQGYVLRWGTPYRQLLAFDRDYELIIGEDVHDDNSVPSLNDLLGHIAAYVRNREAEDLGKKIDQLQSRLLELEALMKTDLDRKGLECLFKSSKVDDKTVVTFSRGKGNLPLYFAHLDRMRPHDRVNELELLIKYYFELIPELLASRADFLGIVRETNLDRITKDNLNVIQSHLIEARLNIHSIAPTEEDFKVKRKSKAEIKPETLVVSPKPPASDKSNKYDQMFELLKRAPYYGIMQRLDIIGYPKMEIEGSTIRVQFPPNDRLRKVFAEECYKHLPTYKSQVSAASQNIPMGRNDNEVVIQSAHKLSRWEKDKLGEIWVKTLIDYLMRSCQVDDKRESLYQSEFLDRIHFELISRLSGALGLLGVRSPVCREITTRTKLDTFLNFVRSIPKSVLVFLNHTSENVELYKMTLDMARVECVKAYQMGALKFISNNHDKLHPFLLNMFADCYFMKCTAAKISDPLGEERNEKLAVLLSPMLLPTVFQADTFIGAEFSQKEEILKAFIPMLQKVLAGLCEFNFKPK